MSHQPFSLGFPKAGHPIARTVRDHPMLSLGAAVGLGVVLCTLARHIPARTRKSRRSDLFADLADPAREAGNRVRRLQRKARQEWHACANRTGEVLPEVNLDRLTRRGLRWLRDTLG